MAVSNSIDFKQTAISLLEDARSELGINADEEPLEDVDLQRGLRLLNGMLKSWQAEGLMVWALTEGSLTLLQGQEGYVFGAGGDFVTVPFEITDCRIDRAGSNIPMFRLSREEYYDLPNPTNQGYPTQFYYDRQRSGGTLHVWPAPDVAAGTLAFTYQRIVMDIDNGTNDFDLPQEWTEAIRFGLAKRLIGPYGKAGTPEAAYVTGEAARSYSVVETFTLAEGKASVSVTPYEDGRGYRRG